MISNNTVFKATYRGCLLIFAAFTVIATSVVNTQIKAGIYNIKSDCPEALTEGTLKFEPASDELGVVAEGAAEFGFPSDTFTLEKGEALGWRDSYLSSNAQGACKGIVLQSDESFVLFSCYQGSELVCTISLTR